MSPAEFAELLKQRDGILILNHRNPDGDTLGSGAALCHALRRVGKRAFIYHNPQITERTDAYIHTFYAPEDFRPETIVAVDIATPGLFPKGFEGHVDLCVDHHPSNSFYADETLVASEKSACGEIILEIIEALCNDVDPEEATLLYIALTTDTGCFQYMNTNADTMNCAARLIALGADHHKVVHDYFRRVSKARVMLEGMIYSGMRFYRDGKITVAFVTRKMLQDAGTTENDLDDLAGLPGRIAGNMLSILIKEQENGTSKVSVRSTPEVDSCAICSQFGGGGHAMASGCTLNCDPYEAERQLLKAVDQVWPA